MTHCPGCWGYPLTDIDREHPCPGIPDDSALDATDLAHPAYWRGQEAGVAGACRVIAKVLDGDDSGACREPLETLRRRARAMREELDALRKERDEFGEYMQAYSMHISANRALVVERDGLRQKNAAQAEQLRLLEEMQESEIAKHVRLAEEPLRSELEVSRMQLAACGTVALANTPEDAAEARQIDPRYQSDSLACVESIVDSEMSLRAERDALRAELRECGQALRSLHAWATTCGAFTPLGVIAAVNDALAQPMTAKLVERT